MGAVAQHGKYGSTKLVEQFDASRKTTLKAQLCQARGDDAAGRTSTLMDEVYRFMEDMEMPVYQAYTKQNGFNGRQRQRAKGPCGTIIG